MDQIKWDDRGGYFKMTTCEVWQHLNFSKKKCFPSLSFKILYYKKYLGT